MIVESSGDVIVLAGALRENFWDAVHTAISLTLKRHPSGVIIDCSQITECTAEGAETFRDVLDFIQEHDARVICVGVPENVMEVLKSTSEVRSQLPIAGSTEEARRSLDLLQESTESKKRPPSDERLPRIVLYLAGDERDQPGLAASKRMADGLHAEVVVTFVIVVPRELPLQAPLKDQEELAVQAIGRAEAFLKSHHVPYRVAIERGRDVATTLEAILHENAANHLLIPLSANPDRLDEELKLIKHVLANVSASVAFIRGEVQKVAPAHP